MKTQWFGIGPSAAGNSTGLLFAGLRRIAVWFFAPGSSAGGQPAAHSTPGAFGLLVDRDHQPPN